MASSATSPSSSPHSGFSRAAFGETSNAKVSNRERVDSWKPLDPNVVSGPKNCPEAITRYADTNCRRGVRLSFTADVKKHLFFLGWKIEYVDRKGVVAYRYTSPEGKTYLSLIKVCEDLRVESPVSTRDQELCRIDFGRLVDSGLQKLEEAERLDDSTDKDDDNDLSGWSESRTSWPLGRFRANYSPQAVVDWHMIALDKSYDRVKKVNVKVDAVGHLLATGWELYYTQKKDRRELRYKSPTGKVYTSLRTACKACIDQGGGASSVPGSQNMATTGKKGDNGLCRAPKERTRKDIACSKKDRGCSKRSKLPGGVRRLSKKVPQQATVVTASSSHRNPRTVLSLLIDNDIVVPRDKVYYNAGKERSVPLAWGRISRQGIKCDCCSMVFTLSHFEAHAGSTKHRPAANIFLEDGRSLLDCQKQLNQMKSLAKSQQPAVVNHKGCVREFNHDRSDRVCSVCHFGGELILCDQCPAAFHCSCLDLKDIPFGEWFCPSCCCGICGRGRRDNGGISSNDRFDGECLNCVQCEQNFHIGCLKINGALDDLNQNVDRKNWFCTRKCKNINVGLQKLLGKQIPVREDNLTWTLVKCPDFYRQNREAAADIEVKEEDQSKLNVALGVMHECFQPVKDPHTHNDLVEDVIFSRKSELKRLNFRGFYTVLLERNDEIITVATVRVYGEKVAEVPLVATRFQYRRQGMCRTLMNVLEAQLIDLGVERLTLPAVPALLNTWTGAFGFSKMAESDRSQLLKYTFLNFQDTIMCQKLLIKTPHLEWRPQKRMKQTVVYDDITDAMDYDGCSSISDPSDLVGKVLDGGLL